MNKTRIAVTLFMAFLGEIANKVVPLVNLHLIAGRLGVDAFGSAQYALWILEWGIVFTTFGFPQVAPVLMREARTREKESRVNGSVVCAKLFLAVFATIVLILMMMGSESLGPYRLAVFTSLFIMLTSALDSSWILAAKQKLAVLSLISIIAKLLSVVAVFSLIQSPDDATLFVIITNAVNALIALASFVVAVKLVGISMPKLEDVKAALSAATPFAIAILMFLIVDRFDLFLVEKNLGSTATGLYSSASKLIGSITPITAAISGVFYSEMLALSDSKSIERLINASLFWIISVIAPLIAFLIWFNDELLTLIFGLSYLGASEVLTYLGLGAFFFAMIVVFGFQLLALKRQWLPLVLGLAAGAISGLVIGFTFLSDGGGLLGVAAASLIAKGLTALIVIVSATMTWRLNTGGLAKALLRPLLPIFGTVLVLLSTMWLPGVSSNPPLNLVIMLVSYVVFFTALNLAEARWALGRVYERFVKKSSA